MQAGHPSDQWWWDHLTPKMPETCPAKSTFLTPNLEFTKDWACYPFQLLSTFTYLADRIIVCKISTHPKTNVRPLKWDHFERKGSSSNHYFAIVFEWSKWRWTLIAFHSVFKGSVIIIWESIPTFPTITSNTSVHIFFFGSVDQQLAFQQIHCLTWGNDDQDPKEKKTTWLKTVAGFYGGEPMWGKCVRSV